MNGIAFGHRVVFLLIAVAVFPASGFGQQAEDLFRQVFGESIRLDPDKVAQVTGDTPGKRHWFDTTGDGRGDECWYVCVDPRHRPEHRPLLVRAVDEDGDMDFGIEPDRDSDLFIADWGADGSVNAMTDHEDLDGDNDLDRMAMYYQLGRSDRLRVWYSFDNGDDNLLWWDQGFRYYQNPSQHHTHFGGDETFINYEWDDERKSWKPLWEAPFLFYDNDGDGITDEVVRIEPSAEGGMGRLRWSFNVDGDGTKEHPRDFDVSISAHADPGISFPDESVERFTIRGYPTGATLSRASARDWLRQQAYRSGLLTWVENDHNVGWSNAAGREDKDYPHERWEGVIANGHPGFEQIGGPPVGPFDRREESAFAASGEPFRYYFNPATHRIHMRDASKGWLLTDYDGDFEGEMRYEYLDLDPVDGVFDRITLDLDNDGEVDDSWEIETGDIVELPFVWQDFHEAYRPVLRDNPPRLYELDRQLAAAIENVAERSVADPVWRLIENRFAGIPERKRGKLLHSDMALMYYLELVRDRRVIELKSMTGSESDFWRDFNAARARGELAVMSELLVAEFGLRSASWPEFDVWIEELRNEGTGGVAWNEEIGAGELSWESDRIAYRFANGGIEFLGKREGRLVLEEFGWGERVDDGGWGVAALDAGETSGCGGLTLFIDGTAYPVGGRVGGPDERLRFRLVNRSSDALTVEALVRDVGPADASRDVCIRATAFAGRTDSRIEVVVEGSGADDSLELGVGFTRLGEQAIVEDREIGTFGIWGVQEPKIGRIGLGVIYSADQRVRRIDREDEHLMVMAIEPGRPLTYHIQADWLRGRRFPVQPSAADWLEELGRTAEAVRRASAEEREYRP